VSHTAIMDAVYELLLELVEKNGERGRNRTFNLLIKSWFSRTRLTAASDPINQ